MQIEGWPNVASAMFLQNCIYNVARSKVTETLQGNVSVTSFCNVSVNV